MAGSGNVATTARVLDDSGVSPSDRLFDFQINQIGNGTTVSGTVTSGEVFIERSQIITIQGIAGITCPSAQGTATIGALLLEVIRANNSYGHYGFACGTNGKIKKIYLY
jgi:hypothetical protein